MADSDRPDHVPRVRDSKHDENPFISFRQFADATISSMLNSVLSLPQAMSAPKKPHNNDNQSVEPKSWMEEYMESSSSKPNTGAASGGDKDNDDDGNNHGFSKRIKELETAQGMAMEKVKPKVYEDEHGNKAWHWSWFGSWGWPPKDGGQSASETDEVDAQQRRAIEEATRNADKRFQDAERLFKAFFDPADKSESSGSDHDVSMWDDKYKEMQAGMREIEKEIQRAFQDVFDFKEGPGQSQAQVLARLPEEMQRTLEALGLKERPGQSQLQVLGARLPFILNHRFEWRWLTEHPYGPGYLEWRYRYRDMLSQNAPPFVDAFEDLIRLERGEPMVQRGERRRHVHHVWPIRETMALIEDHPSTRNFWSETRPGGKWFVPLGLGPILRSQFRTESDKLLGLPAESKQTMEIWNLGKMTPDLYKELTKTLRRQQGRSDSPETADPQSEADMYERFLDGNLPTQQNSSEFQPGEVVNFDFDTYQTDHHDDAMNSPYGEPATTKAVTTHTTQQTQPSPSQNPQIDPSSSRILSMLTTTHRTVEADGSVTTKVVLKKRFADGGEETSETINTEQGNSKESGSGPDDGAAGGKKGGWFWAS